MATAGIEYRAHKPNPELSDYVESYWMLVNQSEEAKDVVVLPDGRFDIFFSYSSAEPFHVTISGLASEPSHSAVAPNSVIFAISFKLLALEYLLGTSIAHLTDKVSYLSTDFWGISVDDLADFDGFCATISTRLLSLKKGDIDSRKQKLMALIYSSQGELSVSELSDAVFWSSRQINRYFQHWCGISLKAYCNIIKYRTSFDQIKEGNLFPEQNYADQAHFSKVIKKFSGVTPKELALNKNDRFIQFSLLART